MADRSLKGTGLGAKSFEDETGIEFEPRQRIGFACSRDHQFSIVFACEVDLPAEWACPRCGTDARRTGGEYALTPGDKPRRTHWDMLRERRTTAELEVLLAERLALLRASRGGVAGTAGEPAHAPRSAGRRTDPRNRRPADSREDAAGNAA